MRVRIYLTRNFADRFLWRCTISSSKKYISEARRLVSEGFPLIISGIFPADRLIFADETSQHMAVYFKDLILCHHKTRQHCINQFSLYSPKLRHNRPSPSDDFVNKDENHRNLRTIIVIADVHWRFGDWREPLPLTFQHWSGVSPYTSPCGFAETCVFGKQSLGKLSLRPAPLTVLGRHIANVRLAFLPSSLTKVLSLTLGYSPSPPVSVLVRLPMHIT